MNIPPATMKTPKRTAKRQAILDAALDLFAQRGFHGTPVPVIAERANVGAGTIYRHFQSKEDLVNVIFQEWRGHLKVCLEAGLDQEAPIRDQFHHLWAQAICFAAENPRAFQFLEMQHHTPYLNEASREIDEQANDVGRSFVERAKQQKSLKEYPDGLLISLIWGALVNVVRASFSKRFLLTDELSKQAEICCWEAIRH